MKLTTDAIFEILGCLFGFSASVFITLQIVRELETVQPSTLSFWYMFGFILNYTFWLVYGIRFKRKALYLANLPAIILQGVLIIITTVK